MKRLFAGVCLAAAPALASIGIAVSAHAYNAHAALYVPVRPGADVGYAHRDSYAHGSG